MIIALPPLASVEAKVVTPLPASTTVVVHAVGSPVVSSTGKFTKSSW